MWGAFLLLAAVAKASQCTDACEELWAVDARKLITICGTDYQTHTFHYHRWMSSDPCYPKCGVGMLYPGKCGCPNDCMAHLKQGTCVESEGEWSCECVKGWGGPDCSNIKCPNSCSKNGVCKPYSAETDLPGAADTCICRPGFTGFDCSAKKHDLQRNPYGNLFPEAEPFTASDPYRDEHPFFNLSVLYTIRMTVNPKDLHFMLDPVNMYTQDYHPANFYFDNGIYQRSINDVGIHIKGAWSRMDMKKGWSVSFNKYSKSRRFFRAKKIGLKGSLPSDSTVKNQFVVEMGRAMSLAVMRTSYGVLYINDIFWGVYWAHEDIDSEFMNNHYGNNKGNLYKLHSVYMQYPSQDPRYYQVQKGTHPMGVGILKYEKDEGDADWGDWIEFLRLINSGRAEDEEYQQRMIATIDVPSFLRWNILEALLSDSDGFASNGNNFLWFHDINNENHPDAKWYFMRIDFDNSDLASIISPSQWFLKQFSRNPMIRNLWAYHNRTYLETFSQVLEMTFGAYSPAPPPSIPMPVQRYMKLRDFLSGMYEKDFFWQTSNGCSGGDFRRACDNNIERLPIRVQFVKQFLPQWAPDRRTWRRPSYVPEVGPGDGGDDATNGKKKGGMEPDPELDGNGNGDLEGVPVGTGKNHEIPVDPDDHLPGQDQDGDSDGNGNSDGGGDIIGGGGDTDGEIPIEEDDGSEDYVQPAARSHAATIAWLAALVLLLVAGCFGIHYLRRTRPAWLEKLQNFHLSARAVSSTHIPEDTNLSSQRGYARTERSQMSRKLLMAVGTQASSPSRPRSADVRRGHSVSQQHLYEESGDSIQQDDAPEMTAAELNRESDYEYEPYESEADVLPAEHVHALQDMSLNEQEDDQYVDVTPAAEPD